MKKTTKIILIALAVIAIILPLLFPIVSVVTPSVYHGSFVGSLNGKIDRLKSIEEEKIVVVGGSSVAFGLDSSLIESYTGMPVVNFGLYASLGTKLMLDLSLPHIKEGDVVILAPEIDAQTLSLYFNGGTTLRALDGNLLNTISAIPTENYGALYGAGWDYTVEKLGYLLGGAPQYEGIYSASSFNEYGDIKAGMRPYNVMVGYKDANLPVSFDKEVLSAEFAEYVNSYIEKCEARGAKVWFSWCPVNSLGIKSGTTAEDISAFEEYMQDSINAPFISNLTDYILPENYFYDTNFHLNDSGMLLRSIRLCEDILMELGNPREVTAIVPDPPGLPWSDVVFEGEDKNAAYFEYEKTSDGSYMIIGVKDGYKSSKTLTVPLGFDGYKVTAIGARAFEGCSVQKLIVTEDTNLKIFMNGAFYGAAELRSLVIRFYNENELFPPGDFVGVHSDFAVYVPEGSNYSSGYYWSQRGLRFEYIE